MIDDYLDFDEARDENIGIKFYVPSVTKDDLLERKKQYLSNNYSDYYRTRHLIPMDESWIFIPQDTKKLEKFNYFQRKNSIIIEFRNGGWTDYYYSDSYLGESCVLAYELGLQLYKNNVEIEKTISKFDLKFNNIVFVLTKFTKKYDKYSKAIYEEIKAFDSGKELLEFFVRNRQDYIDSFKEHLGYAPMLAHVKLRYNK